MKSFWANYGIGKLKDGEKAAKKMVMNADIDGFSDAAIATQMAKVDELTAKKALAEEKLTKEDNDVAIELAAQQDVLNGIDFLQQEIVNSTDEALIALNTKTIEAELAKLEAKQPKIAKEKQEAAEAKQDLAEIQEVLIAAKAKLDGMKNGMEQVKNEIARAERAVERNEERAALAAEKAGYTAPDDTFNTILGAANERLEEIRLRARQAEIKAETLAPKDDTSDVMKAAIAKAKGNAPAATMSVTERLAAIKAAK